MVRGDSGRRRRVVDLYMTEDMADNVGSDADMGMMDPRLGHTCLFSCTFEACT